MSIPRIIFQTWKTKDIPEQYIEAQRSVIEKNKNWRYVFLTDEDNENIVKKYFPDFLPYYNDFRYNIQRADAIRYMILYLYGGVYLDLDYISNRSFDEIILEGGVGVIKSHNVKSLVTNSFLVSKPKSKFWLECIEEMKKGVPWWIVGKHWQVMYSTGPLMITRVYNRNKDIVSVLENISTPCNVCEVSSCNYNPKYILTPVTGNTWHSFDSTFYNWLYCNDKIVVFCVLIIILILLYHYKYNKRKG